MVYYCSGKAFGMEDKQENLDLKVSAIVSPRRYATHEHPSVYIYSLCTCTEVLCISRTQIVSRTAVIIYILWRSEAFDRWSI